MTTDHLILAYLASLFLWCVWLIIVPIVRHFRSRRRSARRWRGIRLVD